MSKISFKGETDQKNQFYSNKIYLSPKTQVIFHGKLTNGIKESHKHINDLQSRVAVTTVQQLKKKTDGKLGKEEN